MQFVDTSANPRQNLAAIFRKYILLRYFNHAFSNAEDGPV